MSKTCESSPCKKKRGGFWFWIIWTLIILAAAFFASFCVICDVDSYNRRIYFKNSMIRAFERANAYNKYQTVTREVECPDGYTRVFTFNFVRDPNTGMVSEEWLAGDGIGRHISYDYEHVQRTIIEDNRVILIILWILGLLLGILVWQLPYWLCKWFKRGTNKLK